ncbi:hypothetical protein cypCar_00013918, partial [Cyprinus carpio]
RHITIQKHQTFPQLERCTKCCNNFHCPFCMASIFKPCRPDKVKLHLKSHCNKAVVHGDFTIHRCGLGCRASLHYHCMYCPTTILRRGDFKNHLQVCKRNPNSESATKALSSTSTPVTPPTVINAPSVIETAESIPSIPYTPPNTNTDMTSLMITDTPSTTTAAAGKFRVRPVIKKRCPSCNILINKNNLPKHMERKHTDQSALDISETFQLTSQCIDDTNGIFAVLKVGKGHGIPLHVQYQALGENNRVLCESSECQINIDVAQRSGITSYQCMHISAASFCKSSAEQVSLEEDVLTEMNKKIPAVLPEDMRVPSPLKDYPQNLCPNETVCQECPGDVLLSDPMLITQNAKILTNWCIIKDVATYCKQCPQCGMFYRYQEWKDRLHNFNDHIILDIPLCLTLRNLLQVHTSVSRAVEFLQRTTGVEFPPADTMLDAYLQFEALTDHEYKYSCPTCGDHPPVVLMGVHKQTASPLSENDIEKPPEDFKGEVSLEEFWESLSKEMTCRGFVASRCILHYIVNF